MTATERNPGHFPGLSPPPHSGFGSLSFSVSPLTCLKSRSYYLILKKLGMKNLNEILSKVLEEAFTHNPGSYVLAELN